jgi:hypothetical protein
MVMSAAYRQSAKSTQEQLAKDPKNQLLSHGPRFRMDAEMLRDIALQSGGLLVDKIGGPSVKPYQPPNVWEQVSYPASDTLNYTQQHGEALYRRSMYTYWKRMATMPDMDAFDAPMRDVVCTRRQRTDTPLQALVTMNDVQWVEAARALAQRVIELGGSKPEQRINMLSEILLHLLWQRFWRGLFARCKNTMPPILLPRGSWLRLEKNHEIRRFPSRNLRHGRWWRARCSTWTRR